MGRYGGLNRIVVAPDHKFIKDNHGFWIPDDFEPGLHAPVTGTVMALPYELRYHDYGVHLAKGKSYTAIAKLRRAKMHTLDCLAPGDVKIGDKVLFKYMAIQNATKDQVSQIDGKKCVSFDYNFLYAILGKEIRMVNGYVLVESFTKHDKTKDVFEGIVRYAGEPAIYQNKRQNPDIQQDTQILFQRRDSARIEVGMHQQIKTESGRPLYRIKRKDILAYVK